jgi:F420H(2)-dependent quinone reductase
MTPPAPATESVAWRRVTVVLPSLHMIGARVPLTDVTARRDRGAGRAAPSRAAGAPGYRGAVPRTAKRLKALGLPGWLAAANPVIIGLGRLGVVPGPVRVLTVPGRTTGEPRTTPVTPVVVAGRRYIIAAAPRADWARNARAVGHGELSEGRRRQAVTIREVHEPIYSRLCCAPSRYRLPAVCRSSSGLGSSRRPIPTSSRLPPTGWRSSNCSPRTASATPRPATRRAAEPGRPYAILCAAGGNVPIVGSVAAFRHAVGNLTSETPRAGAPAAGRPLQGGVPKEGCGTSSSGWSCRQEIRHR